MMLLNLVGLNTEQSAKDTLLLLWLSISSRHLKNSCSTSKMLLILPTRPVLAKEPSRDVTDTVFSPGGAGNPTQSCQASKVLGTLHLLVVGTRADVTPQEVRWFGIFWAPWWTGVVTVPRVTTAGCGNCPGTKPWRISTFPKPQS